MLGPEVMRALSSQIQGLASVLEDQQVEFYERLREGGELAEQTRAACRRGSPGGDVRESRAEVGRSAGA